MYHYTYMLEVKNPTDSRFRYIGVRSCKVKPEEDVYFGSSRSFCKWQDENGVDKIEKTVLGWWPSREQAVKHEILLHDIFDVARNTEFFNRSKQKASGFDTSGTEISEEHKEKVRKAHLGAKRHPSVGQKISKAKIGKRRSLETIEKMRIAFSGKKAKPASEERKQKVSKALKGRRWYNNGKEIKLCVEGEQPSGWVLGDPIRKKDFASGKKWYTNGINEVLAKESEQPTGWSAGRLKRKD